MTVIRVNVRRSVTGICDEAPPGGYAARPRRRPTGIITPASDLRSLWRLGSQGDEEISHSGYRFPPEIIQQAVWLYFRFGLSFRDVEDLLAERGITVSYETVRRWTNHAMAPSNYARTETLPGLGKTGRACLGSRPRPR
jgi:hypothetical protein